VRWRWWRPKNGHAAEAQREQERKLRELRAKKPEIRREVDRFTEAVERALRGST
jgi:hypothetical protein